ncbi:hypothetical protein K440DRAFT_641288 [Wilcoxina mikolae CBS 423.85]|nr:hypothetical protein K440DRAFT_641288 [Wilcoxina mikolae CBS 423.85]
MYSDSRFRHLNCTQGKTDLDDGRSIIENQFGEKTMKFLPKYPYSCVSYDPLKCLGGTVEQMLDTRLKFVKGKREAEVFEVKDGSSETLYLSTEDPVRETEAMVFFVQWEAKEHERIFLEEDLFRDLLLKYEIDPYFVFMLGFPNTGGATCSMTYVNLKPHSLHICLRYPSVSFDIELALYFHYIFEKRQTRVIALEGKDHGSPAGNGIILRELTRNQAMHLQSGPPHPLAYVLPFIQQVGAVADHVRNRNRNELISLEMSTGTSTHDGDLPHGIIDLKANSQENIESLTRNAHLLGSNVAEAEKYLRVQVRAVEECMRGFHKLQQYYETHPPQNETEREHYRIEAERIEDVLQIELDCCKGRQMEVDNLSKRVGIQINMLFSLASQRDSRVNARIAEESKRIAAETRKDSSSMKTIAALTMVFLPGAFIAAVLGMNFFHIDGNSFVVNDKWWIFIAFTIPLTFLVFLVWYGWLRMERTKVGNV